MTERNAKIKDNWSAINSRKNYKRKITKIHINQNKILSEIDMDIESAIHTFCGRNGVGKSSILKEIHASLLNNSYGSYIKVFDKADSTEHIYGNNNESYSDIMFIDSAEESINIRKIISQDTTFIEDYVNHENGSSILNQVIGDIRKILSSDITEIIVIEVEGKLENDKILPFFMIKKGVYEYNSLEMGQGEHKVLYLIWRLLIAKNNSILLLEEPEAFLCAKAQIYLMDFIASIMVNKKIMQ